MKFSDDARVKSFLKEVGSGNMFRDISITRDDNDIAAFQKIRMSVLDEIPLPI